MRSGDPDWDGSAGPRMTTRTTAVATAALFVVAIIGTTVALWIVPKGGGPSVSAVSAVSAESSFDEVRRRFGNVEPAIELREGRLAFVRDVPSTAPQHLETIHILVWEPASQKLSRRTVPFWLLRMRSGPIELPAEARALLAVSGPAVIRADEIERYGSTILVDHTRNDRTQVLIWTD